MKHIVEEIIIEKGKNMENKEETELNDKSGDVSFGDAWGDMQKDNFFTRTRFEQK